ncbi:VanZ family protein [Leeuwenhoekiella palythoae]|uniref:VanZ like family protein n=1 Tax=Leeuwenhoekiella palythoae TaxID=573501 RepID=A0A1M5YRN6_9FLAO|nr:VanZ family protein [Leeuwenhoekiella palythoae]RXG29431.1 VanZ like protein [Leeuwenhoekiella palythoae]SHI14518.1 VanZ like family protein [Leeuwenhoekiella palythoae]
MDNLLKIAVYIYTAFIAFVCLMPMPHISDAPKDSDKIVHLLAYTFFVGLWFLFFYCLKQKKDNFLPALIKSCILAFIYGIIIEILQGELTTSRSADFNDVLANSIGIVIGILLVFLAKTQFIKLKSKL